MLGIRESFGKGVGKSGLSSFFKTRWMEVLYIFGIVAMSTGIVNALASPVPATYIIYPGQGSESIPETVINAMALLMGFGGLYLSYLSGRQTVKPRLVGFYLTLGLLLIAGAVYIEMYIYFAK